MNKSGFKVQYQYFRMLMSRNPPLGTWYIKIYVGLKYDMLKEIYDNRPPKEFNYLRRKLQQRCTTCWRNYE